MTTRSVDFLPAPDPLLRGVPLAYEASHAVLGIETRFATNSQFVRDLVSETFGRTNRGGTAPSPAPSSDAPTVRIIVHDGREHVVGHVPVRHVSTEDNRLFVHTPGSMAVVDASRRESIAYVTAQLVGDRDHFRTSVLEAITLALLASFDRHPVHAAALARNGRTLLLAAPGGAGKSTLAYLAHSAGIRVVSDDLVWVQTHPAVRVWGRAPRVRLGPAAAVHFPEIASPDITGPPTAGKIALDLGDGEPYESDPTGHHVVCALARGTAASLERLDAGALAHELSGQRAHGFDRFPEREHEVFNALAAGGGWRLTLSNDPADALPHILHMLDAGD